MIVALLITPPVFAKTVYVWTNSPANGPGTDWTNAYRDLQSAINVSTNGDIVLATNGTYATGGALTPGYALTNRIVATNAITILSVNGPDVTFIQGKGPLGTGTVRCAYLANGATLSGFTLTNGYTQSYGSWYAEQCGGGAYAKGATITNCNIIGNTANAYGGGVYGGNIYNCTIRSNMTVVDFNSEGAGLHSCSARNCIITQNVATNRGSGGGSGGGAKSSTLYNCLIASNTAFYGGGGASSCTNSFCTIIANYAQQGGGGGLNGGTHDNCIVKCNRAVTGGGMYAGNARNCLIIDNYASGSGGGCGGGSGGVYCFLTNCTVTGNTAGRYGSGIYLIKAYNSIVYYNNCATGPDVYKSTIQFSCNPDQPGNGNILTEPVLASLSHLASNSPCIGAGNSAFASGVDIDGESWITPPSIGCDEYIAGAVTGQVTVAIETPGTNLATGYPFEFTADIQGKVYKSTWNFGDGQSTTNKPIVSHAWSTPGNYPLVLTAYSGTYPGGISATVTIHVISETHYVNVSNATPSEPYTSWATAAIDIQSAINACTTLGATVLVTNGVYNSGTTITPISGCSLFNRIVVTNMFIIQSVNGPEYTFIVGQGPIGALAVRCAYLANGTILSGFTLTNGYTGTAPATHYEDETGGGVYALGATVSNCIISGNSASMGGGGTAYGLINNCQITGNRCTDYGWGGGGTWYSTVKNSLITKNSSARLGGACYYGIVRNCMVIDNSAPLCGGLSYCTAYNSVSYFNSAGSFADDYYSDFYYSCTPSPTSGIGNITSEPILASATHLASNSPCIKAGNLYLASGVDIDGETWRNPPSIGCDEYIAGAVTGNLAVAIQPAATNMSILCNCEFLADIRGKVHKNTWDFGDGCMETNKYIITHAWTIPGIYPVVLTAFNETYPAGISATVNIQVVSQPIHYVNISNSAPSAPYTSWVTAATNIQDAINACTIPGEKILVTNGVYSSGTTITPGGSLSNRIAATNANMIESVNGPDVTFIVGQGPLGTSAVRCAYLANGSVLSGFTITNGFTATSGDALLDRSGGGVYAWEAIITNCIIIGNAANSQGGGTAQGTILNCTVVGNSAGYGGGSINGTIINSTIRQNSAICDAGGIYQSIANNCIISGNLATNSSYTGGGACGSIINNSLITSNNAYRAGGITQGTINNSVIIGNYAKIEYGAASDCTINNCTITSNSANSTIGGVISCKINNSIVYGNTAGTTNSNFSGGTWQYSCTTPDPGGTGNITNDPGFVDIASGNLHLSSNSMCINAGNNTLVQGTTDVDGNPRIRAGIVDMGADESPYASIDASVYAQGSIAPTGRINIAISNDISFIMTNNAGYPAIRDVRIDGISIGPTNDYTFFNVTNCHTIEAVFWMYPDTNGCKIISSAMTTSSNLVFNWRATNGWSYTLQQTPTLIPVAWSNVVPFTNMTGLGDMVITNDLSTNTTMFYRLLATE